MNNKFKKNSYLYDWISCVIPDRVYFGPVPNEFMFEQLKEKKFNILVNLTEYSYNSEDFNIINFPIKDKCIPTNFFDYCKFILNIKNIYENNSENKIYIHCRAGHSRSSMVVVSFLFCVYNEELKYIINKVIEYHRNRVMLREIWKYKSPFNYKQFNFLCLIHKNVYINAETDSKIYSWLSPKNIKNNDYISLYDYVLMINNFDTNIFEKCLNFIKNNHYLSSRIQNTYLKKFTFIFENKEIANFYNILFKTVREKIFYDNIITVL
jgi:protein-tyrosine phosphatase